MSEEEQAAVYLKLREAHAKTKAELVAVTNKLIDTGKKLSAWGSQLTALKDQPNNVLPTLDAATFQADVVQDLPKLVKRYEELQVEKTSQEHSLKEFTNFSS